MICQQWTSLHSRKTGGASALCAIYCSLAWIGAADSLEESWTAQGSMGICQPMQHESLRMAGVRGCRGSWTWCRGAEEAAALAGVLARLQDLTRLKLYLNFNDELGRGPQGRGA